MTFVEAKIVKSRRTEKRVVVGRIESAASQILLSAPLKENENEIYLCYSRKYFRSGGLLDLALRGTRPLDIIAARTNAGNSQVFYQALLCYAILVFGNDHGQAHITKQGYAMRGVALRQLNQALSDPKCYTQDSVILSVVTMAILECVVPTGPNHYLQHMIGLERLLELRGPGLYRSQESSLVFKDLRHMILFASLCTGKPSILANQEWKAVLRANCSDEELQEQDLFDVLADCTVLISERNNLLATWSSDLEKSARKRDIIKQRGLELLADLHAWKRRWDGNTRNSYSENSTLLGQDTSSPFSTVYEFSDHRATVMFMFYNTTLIYVLQILASLPLSINNNNLDQSLAQGTSWNAGYQGDFWNLPSEQFIAMERSAALQVCRCIPYYLDWKSKSNVELSPVVHWAVTQAWRTLGGHESAEGRWMRDILNRDGRRVIAQALWAR